MSIASDSRVYRSIRQLGDDSWIDQGALDAKSVNSGSRLVSLVAMASKSNLTSFMMRFMVGLEVRATGVPL